MAEREDEAGEPEGRAVSRKTDRCQGNEGNLHFVKLSAESWRRARVKGEDAEGRSKRGRREEGRGFKGFVGTRTEGGRRKSHGWPSKNEVRKFRVTLASAVI